MKFLLCLLVITLILNRTSGKVSKDSDLILKLNENYSNKIGYKNIDNFKSMIFRELDMKAGAFDKHMNALAASSNNTVSNLSTRLDQVLHPTAGDYISTERLIKFYISHASECSIYVNDTVTYAQTNSVNFVEHMILHNNAENIDPKGVFSDKVNINFFAFNKKLNIFSVYFENTKNNKITSSQNKINNFTVEYDYEAVNIIKSNVVQGGEQFIETDNDTSTLFSSNSFIWKILNQNLVKSKENVTLEVHFDLGRDFQHEDVEFSLNFTKSVLKEDKKSIIKYVWKGELKPQEVLVLQAKFPLYFEHCGNITINLVMIFVGSVFIIFLIGMLYIILSTVFSDDVI